MTRYEIVRELILDIPVPKTKDGMIVAMDIVRAAVERDKQEEAMRTPSVSAPRCQLPHGGSQEDETSAGFDPAAANSGEYELEGITTGQVEMGASTVTPLEGQFPEREPLDTAQPEAPKKSSTVEQAREKASIAARLDAYKAKHITSYAGFLAKLSGGKLKEEIVTDMGEKRIVALEKWRILDAVLDKAEG